MERIKIERTDKRSASNMAHPNSFDARDRLKGGTKTYTYFSLPNAEVAGLTGLARNRLERARRHWPDNPVWDDWEARLTAEE